MLRTTHDSAAGTGTAAGADAAGIAGTAGTAATVSAAVTAAIAAIAAAVIGVGISVSRRLQCCSCSGLV